MTDEEWSRAETALSPPFGYVKLLIDGYDVHIEVVQIKRLKFKLAVYVNGYIKAEWSLSDCDIRRRFYYESKKSLLKQSEKAKLKKMRKADRERIMQRAAYSVFLPYWGSFSRLKSHLIKNNQSIELVECV